MKRGSRSFTLVVFDAFAGTGAQQQSDDLLLIRFGGNMKGSVAELVLLVDVDMRSRGGTLCMRIAVRVALPALPGFGKPLFENLDISGRSSFMQGKDGVGTVCYLRQRTRVFYLLFL